MSGLTLAKIEECRRILDSNPVPYGWTEGYDDLVDTEIVEFCGFKLRQKKQQDHERFDVAKWAKRMGINYLPKQDDSQWTET